MNIILFDDQLRDNLLPLAFTRPIADFRIGILTIAQKWERRLQAEVSYLTEEYLQEKFPLKISSQNILINSSVCPNDALIEAIISLNEGDALMSEHILIAVNLNESSAKEFDCLNTESYKKVKFDKPFLKITFPEDIFNCNDSEIRKDFSFLTRGRTSGSLSSTNIIIGDDIFVEEGAEAECSTFNTRQGPIYLGRNSQVWEGCHIRGSFSLGEDAIVKMGAKIYGMTTIGPGCKIGGEVNNSVLFAHSSKGHEGFLGNSVLGEWCNIGADTNNSNMKNNYADVRLWAYSSSSFRRTGLQFCGLVMADHAKCAINTMFNTGTVVGVSANIFGSGFPRNFVPDFSWGGNQGFEVYALEKMFETAEKVFKRRDVVFTDVEKRMLTQVFKLTEKFRKQ